MNYPYYGYQNNYQPNYQNSYQNPDTRIWVTGTQGAEAYLVAPNSSVRLWDTNEQRFYEKTADGTGRPTIKVFRYEEVTSQPVNDITGTIKALEDRIKALEGAINEQSRGNDETV